MRGVKSEFSFRFTGPKTVELASTSDVRLNSAPSETAISDDSDGQIDLVGGPFAVIESDPGKPIQQVLILITQAFSHP